MYDPKAILHSHISGLYKMVESIPENLDSCIEKLQKVQGRIICTGVGKSSFILQKISSNFASIGIACQFLDAIHSVHGELGGLRERDIILAGSYAGQSVELVPIFTFAKTKNIFSMLMTAFPLNRLGKMASTILRLPEVKEVGPLGCVPSTSSLVMLALGDLLVSALEQNITLERYQTHHPHGALGFKLSPVIHTMVSGSDLPLVSIDTPFTEVLMVMSEKRLGCTGVIDKEGKLQGVISDGDVRRFCMRFRDVTSYSALEIMQKAPKTLPPHAIVNDALTLMEVHKITFVFIIDHEQKPLGVIHIHDSWKNIQ
ncbi:MULTISPECIES: CBS domain-containing protein [Holospora]|uniref:Putative phosphosugar isomerase n=2 Tax=Holospora TaxID=44747 RepID=A0A061JJ21_9PROT|nr:MULTISPECIES: CBS domain-containing protein [Holospora]ETZ05554.1 putative phosphosugar isomerase [Holospora undulata HU1]GAJ46280.1 putative phosphosugar isomerase [Holospora elegans E1]